MTQDLELPGYRGRVRPGVLTIADRLGNEGYQCFLSGKWHLGRTTRRSTGSMSSSARWSAPRHFGIGTTFSGFPDNGLDGIYTAEEFYGTDALGDYALDFLALAQERESPWFLYLAFNAPHFPSTLGQPTSPSIEAGTTPGGMY